MFTSLGTISYLNTLSNWALIICAALTAIALVLNILTGNILNRDLKSQVAKSNEKAEIVQLERLQLEKELAPRIMEQRQSSKALLKFQGTNVIIESIAESEPWRLARQIAWTLENAKWNVMPGMKRFDETIGFFNGVIIEAVQGIEFENGKIKQDAASALVDILKKNNIEAHKRPSIIDLPKNTIKIKVGLKPITYFQRNREDFEYGNMLYK